MTDIKICEYCHKEITQNDDAVVCPECGAPYHRDCYSENGRCVYEQKHGNGWAYDADKQQPAEKVNVFVQCPNCGSANQAGETACRNCNAPLPTVNVNNFPNLENSEQNQQDRRSFGGIPPINPMSMFFESIDMNEELDDGVTVKDVSEYLGQNKLYFLPKFIYMKKNNKSVSWNWSATFFGYYYLFYRKLTAFAVLLLVLISALELPSLLVNIDYLAETGMIQKFGWLTKSFVNEITPIANITSWISTVAQILVGLFFNKIYMEYVIKKVRKIRLSVTTDEEFSQVAAKKGGVIKPSVVIAALLLFSLLMSVIYYILI